MAPCMALRAANAALSPQLTPSARHRMALLGRATIAKAYTLGKKEYVAMANKETNNHTRLTSASGLPAVSPETGCRS